MLFNHLIVVDLILSTNSSPARLWNGKAFAGLLSPPLPTAAITSGSSFFKHVVLYLNNSCVVYSRYSQRMAVAECDCFTLLLVSHLPLALTWGRVKNNELPLYALKKKT